MGKKSLTLQTTPYRFQRQDVRAIERMGGKALVSWDMGLGKSLLSLFFLIRDQAGRLPAVVVCPAGLKEQWIREALHHTGMRGEVLEGMRPPGRGLPLRSPLTVVNYEVLWPWMDYLRSLDARTVIVDEAHLCSGRETLRTRGVQRLCEGVGHLLFLTGTPILSRPAELFPILNLISPEGFPAFRPYGVEFCGPKKERGVWTYKGATNLDKLHELLSPLMVRRRKVDVLTSLPPKRRIVLPLSLGKKASDEYTHAVRDFRGWIRGREPKKAGRILRQETLSKLGYLKRLAAELKMGRVREWIDNFLAGGDGKLIVFGVHRKILHGLHGDYRGISVLVDGGVTGGRRQQSIDQFLGERRRRILFGNIEAAGVGWSGKGVGTVAFCELSWMPGKHTQAEDRVWGIGRGVAGESPEVYYLVAAGTIESDLLEILQRKQKVSSTILDGRGKGEHLDVYDQLLKRLSEGGVRAPRNRKTVR